MGALYLTVHASSDLLDGLEEAECINKMPVHKTREVKEVIDYLKSWFRGLTGVAELTEKDEFHLLYRNAALNPDSTLEAHGIVKDEDVYLCHMRASENNLVKPKPASSALTQPLGKSASEDKSISEIVLGQQGPCDPRYLPTEPRVGYTTIPSRAELEKMTYDQLTRLDVFVV